MHFIFMFFFTVIKEDEVPTEESAVSDIPIAYISLGVACSLLLLCSAIAFWNHKRSSHKRLERLPLLLCASVSCETS